MLGQIDIITSTLGKALGGPRRVHCRARRLADYLTQRSRPQLFSNALPPQWPAARSRQCARRAPPRAGHQAARERPLLREQLIALGFKPLPGETPIVPVILGETAKAIEMSELLLAEGVFVTGSAILLSHKDMHGCAASCRRLTPAPTSTRPPRLQESGLQTRLILMTLLCGAAPVTRASLGFEPGADSMLADWSRVSTYMNGLAQRSPYVTSTRWAARLRTGRSSWYDTSPANQRGSRHQARTEAPRRPRLLTDTLLAELRATQPAVILISNNIHLDEIGSSRWE